MSKTFSNLAPLAKLLLVVVSCCPEPAANAPAPASPPPPSRAIAPKPPLDPSYRTLSTDATYYAITEIDEERDQYLVTFHETEGAYCKLGISTATGAIRGGCGFPAKSLGTDTVPSEKRDQLPALRAYVKLANPGATNIYAKFLGTDRTVVLDEFRPCDFASKGRLHGHDYTRVHLRFNADFTTLLGAEGKIGSNCSASFCYWCAPNPKWLPYRSATPQLGPLRSVDQEVPPDLLEAVFKVVREPERDWPVPSDPSGD